MESLHSSSFAVGCLSEMASHQEAGRSQVVCFVFRSTKFASPAEWPLSPCFHPHSQRAMRSLVLVGRFSFQTERN
jgi:hypothetical protein